MKEAGEVVIRAGVMILLCCCSPRPGGIALGIAVWLLSVGT